MNNSLGSPFSSMMVALCRIVESENALELKLEGELTVGHLTAIKGEILSLLGTRAETVVDLDAVEAIDGAGVQFLISLKLLLDAAGSACRVIAGAEIPKAVLANAGADLLLGVAS